MSIIRDPPRISDLVRGYQRDNYVRTSIIRARSKCRASFSFVLPWSDPVTSCQPPHRIVCSLRLSSATASSTAVKEHRKVFISCDKEISEARASFPQRIYSQCIFVGERHTSCHRCFWFAVSAAILHWATPFIVKNYNSNFPSLLHV